VFVHFRLQSNGTKLIDMLLLLLENLVKVIKMNMPLLSLSLSFCLLHAL